MRPDSTMHSVIIAVSLKPDGMGHTASNLSSAVLGKQAKVDLPFVRINSGYAGIRYALCISNILKASWNT